MDRFFELVDSGFGQRESLNKQQEELVELKRKSGRTASSDCCMQCSGYSSRAPH